MNTCGVRQDRQWILGNQPQILLPSATTGGCHELHRVSFYCTLCLANFISIKFIFLLVCTSWAPTMTFLLDSIVSSILLYHRLLFSNSLFSPNTFFSLPTTVYTTLLNVFHHPILLWRWTPPSNFFFLFSFKFVFLYIDKMAVTLSLYTLNSINYAWWDRTKVQLCNSL